MRHPIPPGHYRRRLGVPAIVTVTLPRSSRPTSNRIIDPPFRFSSRRPGALPRAFPFEAPVLLPGTRSSNLRRKGLLLKWGKRRGVLKTRGCAFASRCACRIPANSFTWVLMVRKGLPRSDGLKYTSDGTGVAIPDPARSLPPAPRGPSDRDRDLTQKQ